MDRRLRVALFTVAIVLMALGARLIFPAESATPTRKTGELSTLPSTAPQEFDLLDKTGQWVQMGAIDVTTTPHSFIPTGNAGGGGNLAGAVTAGATATTGPLSATLPAASGKTTFICGFLMTSGGTTTALVVQGNITGLTTTLPLTYVYVSSGQGVLGTAYPACIPASAANTSITVTIPGGGVGTTASLAVWGSQQ